MAPPFNEPIATDSRHMDQSTLHALVADDMRAVDQEIERRLSSDVVLINELSQYIIGNGGKRLRPLITLIASKALGYEGKDHIRLATIIEFIHTATLLHDDVVDASEMRRGQASANAVWGNEASVLVGDFLYSRAFEMMVDINNMRVMDILANTTNTIAEGEVMQLMNCHNPDVTEEQYIEVIRSKTAKLFEAATRLGAVITGQDESTEQAMAEYGMHLGTAFQLVDDVLDYGNDSEVLGKNVGDDLAEGKPTLPLIYAMRQGDAGQQALVRQAIEHGGLEQLDAIAAAIESTGSIPYTARQAEREAILAENALSTIPESSYKEALIQLAQMSVHRDH
ncbi:MAG: octaprenyl diphosphate synthase [Gammaproteobacteria bacterium]|nr:MAG: octaprenyl diphosphate synthase [Gammaproteobacteria bacterium]